MQGFEHEITQAMTDAYASACKLLGLTGRADPASGIIAMKIIDLAQQGETDSLRLCQSVMMHCGLHEFAAKHPERECQAKSGLQH